MGVMAGTLDLMQRAYLGMEIRDEVLVFEPQLPGPIQELSFAMQFRRTPLLVTLSKNSLTLVLHPDGASGPVKVGVGSDIRELRPGDQHMFRLSPGPSAKQRRASG